MAEVTHPSKNNVNITEDSKQSASSLTKTEKSANKMTVEEADWAIEDLRNVSTAASPKYVIKNDKKSDRHGFDSAEFDHARFDDTE